MSRKERQYAAVSDEDTVDLLNQQFLVYQSVQNQAKSLLRIIIALITASISLIAGLLFRIFEVEVMFVSYSNINNSMVKNTELSSDALLLVSTLMLVIGFFVATAGVFFAFRGVSNLFGILTETSFHPFLPKQDGQKFVSSKGGTEDILTSWLSKNQAVISTMREMFEDGKFNLTMSIFLILISAVASLSAYFSNLALIALVCTVIVNMVMTGIFSYFSGLKFDMSTKAEKKFEEHTKRVGDKYLKLIFGGWILLILINIFVIVFVIWNSIYIYIVAFGSLIGFGIVCALLIQIRRYSSKFSED